MEIRNSGRRNYDHNHFCRQTTKKVRNFSIDASSIKVRFVLRVVVKLGPVQVLERWSATENVTEALKSCKKKGWSARVLELRKTSWSTGKLRKIGWSAGALILN